MAGTKKPSNTPHTAAPKAAAVKKVPAQAFERSVPVLAPRGAKMKALQQAVWLSVGGKSRKRSAVEISESEPSNNLKKAKISSAGPSGAAQGKQEKRQPEKKDRKRFLPPPMDSDVDDNGDHMEVDDNLSPLKKRKPRTASNKENNVSTHRSPLIDLPVPDEAEDHINNLFDDDSNFSESELPSLMQRTDDEDGGSESDEDGDLSSEVDFPESLSGDYERKIAFETPSWAPVDRSSNKQIAGPGKAPSRSGGAAVNMKKTPAIPKMPSTQPQPHISKGKLVVPARTSSTKTRKSSKTALATADYEQPTWNDLTDDDDIKSAVAPANKPHDQDDPELEPDYDSDIEIVDPRHGHWPSETHLVYPASGAKIALGPQNVQVQRTSRAAISGLLRSMCFENAFPDVRLRTKFNRDALYNAAKDLGFKNISERIQSDLDYVDALAGLTNPRMGIHRLDMKKSAAASAPGYYGLSAKTSVNDINSLIIDDTYIYPRQGNKIENSRPYRHPILVAIIKDQIFTGSNSLGVRHCIHFTSSLEGTAAESEIPASLLALAATATYAAIAEYLSGDIKTDFSASLYTDAYHRHITTINDIKSHNPRAYHALTASLFNDCCGINIASGPRATIQGINYEGMATMVDGC